MNVPFAVLVLSISLLLTGLAASASSPDELPGADPAIGSETPDSDLIASLSSREGSVRIKATAECFRRGKAMLSAMERAGAKLMVGLNPPRLDVIYTLLKGIPPSVTYRKDSLGLHLQGAVTRQDVARLEDKYGLNLPAINQVRPGSSPTCYVNLPAGKSLFKVMRELLEKEPNLVTINLNYTES